jgi:drug/metabolite transporter (DMT)-like permease
MVFSGAMFLIVGTLLGEWGQVSFTTRSASAMAYLIVVGSIVGYTSYVFSLRHLPLSTVSLYAYVNPVIAVVLGTLVLGEPLSARILLAAALVFAGIVIVRRASRGGVLAPFRQKAVA